MKRSKIIIFLILIFINSGYLFAISDSSIRKALSSLSGDLKRMPKKIKNISVYGVARDSEDLYKPSYIKMLVEKAIKNNNRFSLVSRENLSDSLHELELSATGAIDYSSVKQLGKMSGVDSFMFVYPTISGRGDKRITILIKAVNVTTGAIIFVKEYSYQELSFFNLVIGAKFPVYHSYKIKAKGSAENQNTIHNWNVNQTLHESTGLQPEAFVGLNLPVIGVGIIAGINFMSWNEGVVLNPPEGSYINGVQQKKIDLFGFELDAMPIIFAGLSLPVSSLWGDKNEIIRLRLAYGFGSISSGHISVHSKLYNSAELQSITFTDVSTSLSLIRIGLDFALASSINFVIDTDILNKWKMQTKTVKGITYSYEGTSGLQLSMGLQYKIF